MWWMEAGEPNKLPYEEKAYSLIQRSHAYIYYKFLKNWYPDWSVYVCMYPCIYPSAYLPTIHPSIHLSFHLNCGRLTYNLAGGITPRPLHIFRLNISCSPTPISSSKFTLYVNPSMGKIMNYYRTSSIMLFVPWIDSLPFFKQSTTP